MTVITPTSLVAAVLIVSSVLSCDKDAGAKRALRGQQNAKVVFYGRAVDQAGHPLSGVQFVFDIESIPKDWTFDKRGEDHPHSKLNVSSDKEGKIEFEVNGHIIWLVEAKVAGYQHLVDLDASRSESMDNGYYYLSRSGIDWFHSDANNPAVYVFVRDGVSELTALPSRGGWDSGGGQHWTANEPRLPLKPSIPGIKFVGSPLHPPATRPSTSGGANG